MGPWTVLGWDRHLDGSGVTRSDSPQEVERHQNYVGAGDTENKQRHSKLLGKEEGGHQSILRQLHRHFCWGKSKV